MASIFTKIINREIPAYIVAEDDKHIAFLDINPNAKGHTLAIPKREVDKIFDLTKQEYMDLMTFARKIAKAQEKVIDCQRIGMAVIGLEVPHVHVHLIPLNKMSDMNFKNSVSLRKDEFTDLQNKIATAFNQID